jgi:hypothetical protein
LERKLAVGLHTSPVLDDFFHVGGKGDIHYRHFSGFFLMPLASAMHSEMVRRGGTGEWITATDNLSCFITTSAPDRTRANREAKLLAASISEM